MAQEKKTEDEKSRNGIDIANRPACAACKHLRRRCIQRKCIIWSLFPAAKTKESEVVHKLFGISNITKLILDLDSGDKRAEAARTLKYEAMERIRDPVRGVSGEIFRLRQKVEMLEDENRQVRWLQENPLPRPVHGATGEILRLREKVEMLEEENRQLRHRLQESPLPLPVHHQQREYDSGRIVMVEAAGRNGSNIVNGESSQEGVGVGVAETGSCTWLERSFQQESVDGHVAAFLPEYWKTHSKE